MPNKTKEATLGELSYEILQDLIRPLAHEATLKAVHHEKAIRRKYGKEFFAKPVPAPNANGNGSAMNTQTASPAAEGTPTSSAGNTPSASTTTTTPTTTNKKSSATPRVEVNGRIAYNKVPGRDIYGNEKPSTSRYFECDNCRRKVASSRFAAHIERCLSGRNSRNNNANNSGQRNYNDSSASPPSDATGKKPSPNKKRKVDETLPKTQVSKFMDRSKPSNSAPVSRDPSPGVGHRSVSEGPSSDSFPRKKPVSTS